MMSAHLLKSMPRDLFEFFDASPEFLVIIWSGFITSRLRPWLDLALVLDAIFYKISDDVTVCSGPYLSYTIY